jgi:DDE superfamily endonuclease
MGMIRSHWRGWHITLFEDRGSPHTAEDSQEMTAELDIHLRFLPKACPELDVMDQLFRFVKSQGVANRPTLTIDQSADAACSYLYQMSRRERLVKAGVMSATSGWPNDEDRLIF